MVWPLQAAYAVNILILVPVLLALSRGVDGVFAGRVADSEGLRWLVFSLWLAILLLSTAGLFRPRELWPVLALQVIYKGAWLAVFALPLAVREGMGAVPWGVAATFIPIVILWPPILIITLVR